MRQRLAVYEVSHELDLTIYMGYSGLAEGAWKSLQKQWQGKVINRIIAAKMAWNSSCAKKGDRSSYSILDGDFTGVRIHFYA